jgi:hypothetical protein
MNEDKEIKIKKDTLKKVIIGIAVFVIAFLIFGTGIFIGEMKARFSFRWAENYHQNFGGPRGGIFGDWRMVPPNSEFIEGYGTVGQIIKTEGSTFVIKGRGDMEKIVLIKDDTVIKRGRTDVGFDNLKVDEYVVIIGEPNDVGQIEAKLIRVLSSMEASFNSLPSGVFLP